jgi:hydrogenase nickel incorporation protein HypA/HybF
MHEVSIAKSILSTILEVASKNKAREVSGVEMEVGEICLINKEQLVYLIGVLAHDTIAKEMKISIKEVKTKIKCKNCSYSGDVEYKEVDPTWHYRVPIFACVRCKSNMTEIIQGKELIIKTIDATF